MLPHFLLLLLTLSSASAVKLNSRATARANARTPDFDDSIFSAALEPPKMFKHDNDKMFPGFHFPNIGGASDARVGFIPARDKDGDTLRFRGFHFPAFDGGGGGGGGGNGVGGNNSNDGGNGRSFFSQMMGGLPHFGGSSSSSFSSSSSSFSSSSSGFGGGDGEIQTYSSFQSTGADGKTHSDVHDFHSQSHAGKTTTRERSRSTDKGKDGYQHDKVKDVREEDDEAHDAVPRSFVRDEKTGDRLRTAEGHLTENVDEHESERTGDGPTENREKVSWLDDELNDGKPPATGEETKTWESRMAHPHPSSATEVSVPKHDDEEEDEQESKLQRPAAAFKTVSTETQEETSAPLPPPPTPPPQPQHQPAADPSSAGDTTSEGGEKKRGINGKEEGKNGDAADSKGGDGDKSESEKKPWWEFWK